MFTIQHMKNPAEMTPYTEAQFAVLCKAPDGTRGYQNPAPLPAPLQLKK